MSSTNNSSHTTALTNMVAGNTLTTSAAPALPTTSSNNDIELGTKLAKSTLLRKRGKKLMATFLEAHGVHSSQFNGAPAMADKIVAMQDTFIAQNSPASIGYPVVPTVSTGLPTQQANSLNFDNLFSPSVLARKSKPSAASTKRSRSDDSPDINPGIKVARKKVRLTASMRTNKALAEPLSRQSIVSSFSSATPYGPWNQFEGLVYPFGGYLEQYTSPGEEWRGESGMIMNVDGVELVALEKSYKRSDSHDTDDELSYDPNNDVVQTTPGQIDKSLIDPQLLQIKVDVSDNDWSMPNRMGVADGSLGD